MHGGASDALSKSLMLTQHMSPVPNVVVMEPRATIIMHDQYFALNKVCSIIYARN